MEKVVARFSPDVVWQEFRNGNLSGAEKLCLAALNVDIDSRWHLPLAETWGMQAYLQHVCGWHHDALKRLRRLLTYFPEDRVAQQMMLDVEDTLTHQTQGSGTPNYGKTRMGTSRLVLGIGSGRSGSTTLASLLNAQTNSLVSHEHPPLVAWTPNTNAEAFHLKRFRRLLTKFDTVGDVSHWWLPRLTKIVEEFPSVKVIALKRNKEETIASFLKIKGGDKIGSINHWIDNSNGNWKKSTWDICYPKYEKASLSDSISKYYDQYYSMVDEFADYYPDIMRVFATELLSNVDTQAEILLFAGIDENRQLHIPGLQRNTGTIFDGNSIYHNR